MLTRWRAFTSKFQRLFRLVILFCVLRFVIGIAFLLVFDRSAVAWGPELTAIVVVVVAVYVLVALAVRRWSPPRRADS
jgi:membrane protein implicated in regulation of membrane protease activity